MGSVTDGSTSAGLPEVMPFGPFQVPSGDLPRLRAEFEECGAAVIGPPGLDATSFVALRDEAKVQRRSAAWELSTRSHPDSTEQDTMRAQLGPVARQLVASSACRALLQAVSGMVVVPGYSATCFTYYEREGDYLGVHRDKPDACALACLFYLDASWDSASGPSDGMRLHVCRDEEGRDVAMRITGWPGRIVISDGSRWPHRRPPLGAGESLALLAGCFERFSG